MGYHIEIGVVNQLTESKIKKRSINIILICNAVLLSYLETFIPIPVPIPGIKIGLANIITIIAIVYLSFKDVIFIVAFRCLIMAVLSKGFMMLMFSLSGGLVSAIVMWIIYKKFQEYFSIIGVSIIGALTHNFVQIVIASVLMKENLLLYYVPVLFLAAVITGFLNGSICVKVLKELDKKRIFV
jgi:heptaprenyl diphosphate synthase